jgi:hypothetical protein
MNLSRRKSCHSWLSQLLDIILNDIQGGFLETLDDPLGHDRPDPLDQPGPEIFFNPVDRCRGLGLAEDDLELLPVFRVVAPFTFHPDDFAGSRVDDSPDNGYQVTVTVDFDFGNRVAGFFVGVSDAFDLALEDCEDGFRGGQLTVQGY